LDDIARIAKSAKNRQNSNPPRRATRKLFDNLKQAHADEVSWKRQTAGAEARIMKAGYGTNKFVP
jgi:hypothetical protein